MYTYQALTVDKGVNGLTARDIKLVIDGGFNTVESIAYTYVWPQCKMLACC